MQLTVHHTVVGLLLLLVAVGAGAADVNLNGVMGNRALLAIDGAKPQWLSVGQSSPQGVKLVAVIGDAATVEVGGKRETLTMGQSARLASGGRAPGTQSIILNADNSGHFVTTGTINGVSVRFLVDTGASFISMGASEAKRLGINYTAGQRGLSSTANGVVPVYRVKLDEVRLGDVVLNNVDGTVHPSDNLPIVLLGMSFLNRMEMKRDGERMILTKRF